MDVLQVETWRVREPERPLREGIDPGGIEELAESIREHGLLNPITVRDRGGFYEVVAGHRRLLAARRLGSRSVSVVVVSGASADAEVLGAHENLIRRDLSVAEEARLVTVLMAREGWGVVGAARALNRSEGWVRDRLDILQWPASVVAAVVEGKVSLGAVKALMVVEDEGTRAELLGYAVSNGCSVALAKRWAADANLGRWASGEGVVALSKDGGAPGPVMARTRCFLCDVDAAFVDLVYMWCHRECVAALAEGLREAKSEETDRQPPF